MRGLDLRENRLEKLPYEALDVIEHSLEALHVEGEFFWFLPTLSFALNSYQAPKLGGVGAGRANKGGRGQISQITKVSNVITNIG